MQKELKIKGNRVPQVQAPADNRRNTIRMPNNTEPEGFNPILAVGACTYGYRRNTIRTPNKTEPEGFNPILAVGACTYG